MTQITPEEALKSKKNFEEFLMDYHHPLITSTLADYMGNDTSVTTVQICDLTQKMETLVDLLNLPEIAKLKKAPFIIWLVTSEKKELVGAADVLNQFGIKNIKIFIFKAFLNGNKIDLECILKPKKVETSSGGKAKQIQLEYWQKYFDICDELGEGDYQVDPKPQHWQYVPLGKTGISLQLTVNTQIGFTGVDLFISNDKSLYAKLETVKAKIEEELGTLDWVCNENVKSSRVRKSIKCDIQNEETIKETVTQHIELAKAFKTTFSKYL